MDTTTREILRNNLLLQLSAAGERGAVLATLALGAKTASFRFPDHTADVPDAVREEVAYLADKGLVVAKDKTISPENRRYRITATGRDHLAEEGLA